MEREPLPEPDDPSADTGRFEAFVKGEHDEAARSGAPRFPAGVLALLAAIAVVVVVAAVLLRG